MNFGVFLAILSGTALILCPFSLLSLHFSWCQGGSRVFPGFLRRLGWKEEITNNFVGGLTASVIASHLFSNTNFSVYVFLWAAEVLIRLSVQRYFFFFSMVFSVCVCSPLPARSFEENSFLEFLTSSSSFIRLLAVSRSSRCSSSTTISKKGFQAFWPTLEFPLGISQVLMEFPPGIVVRSEFLTTVQVRGGFELSYVVFDEPGLGVMFW